MDPGPIPGGLNKRIDLSNRKNIFVGGVKMTFLVQLSVFLNWFNIHPIVAWICIGVFILLVLLSRIR